MKKVLLLCLIILGFGFNVYADGDGPSIARYDVYVSNKDGAICYEEKNNSYKKTDKVISYGSIVNFYSETTEKYIYVDYYDDKGEYQFGCYVETKNLSPKNSEFNLKSDDIVKINPVKAVILANGGLNLRKGPATIFSQITLIPQYSVVTLKYRVGDYWYYAEYNGKSGWITGENAYFGMNNDAILYSVKDIEIYSDKALTKKIGTIPKFTEVTNYLSLVTYEPAYYVNYNGIIGSIRTSFKKVNGKIKLTKDAKVYEDFDGKKLINTVKKGAEYDYTLINHNYYGGDANIYIPSLKGWIFASDDYDKKGYEIVGEETLLIKENGYLGENLFGEITKQENSNSNNISNSNLVIICVITAVILSFTIIIIIKLINKKKGK